MYKDVAVVIPVYNGEAFIGDAIESVLEQTYPVHEIIVVNDGSQDTTLLCLQRFGSAVQVISVPNGGVSNARNIGLALSRSEFIAFLDADDTWESNKLELQMSLFAQHPQVGFTCCDYLTSDEANHLTNHFSQFAKQKHLEFDKPVGPNVTEILLAKNIVGTCSNVILRRDLLAASGVFNPHYKQSEDYDLWLRLALHTQFIFDSRVLVKKRRHDSNLTRDFLTTLLWHEKVLVHFFRTHHSRLQKSAKEAYLQGLSFTRYNIGNLYFEQQEYRTAFSYFSKGFNTEYSFKNLLLFARYFSRKAGRLIFNIRAATQVSV